MIPQLKQHKYQTSGKINMKSGVLIELLEAVKDNIEGRFFLKI